MVTSELVTFTMNEEEDAGVYEHSDHNLFRKTDYKPYETISKSKESSYIPKVKEEEGS